MITPLDQFEIIPILVWYCKYTFTYIYDLSVSNLHVMFLYVGSLIIVFMYIMIRQYTVLQTRYFWGLHSLFIFLKNLISENIGFKYFFLFYNIAILFIFILIFNLLGMIPYSFTITSHLIITLILSASFFFAINIMGIGKHGLKLFGLFLPSGAPLLIAPFLICVEFISYIARLFSLGIRLFANMMAGHTLLTILAGFGWGMFNTLGLFTLLFIFPVTIVLAVTGLEISIAFLQAYVFTILVSIYYNDIINLH